MKEKNYRYKDTPNMSFVARVPLEREPRSSSPPQTCYVVWCGDHLQYCSTITVESAE